MKSFSPYFIATRCMFHIKTTAYAGFFFNIAGRRNRASFCSEKAHELLFDTLKLAHRYDDSLIISVADHGEN